MRLLFVDPAAPSGPRPEDHPVGSSRNAALRVAGALASRRGHDVALATAGAAPADDGIERLPLDALDGATPADAVVLVGARERLRACRDAHPDARLHLWLRHVPRRCGRALARAAVATDATLVVASEHHHRATRAALLDGDRDLGGRVRIRAVVDPVPSAPRATGGARGDRLVLVDPGPTELARARRALARLERARPEGAPRLAAAVPPERADAARAEGVEVLRAASEREALAALRGSWALLHARTEPVTPVAVALAGAAGIPAVAHARGSAPEAVPTPEHLVDAADADALARKLDAWWSEGAPRAAALASFRLASVVDRWCALLEDEAPTEGWEDPPLALPA